MKCMRCEGSWLVNLLFALLVQSWFVQRLVYDFWSVYSYMKTCFSSGIYCARMLCNLNKSYSEIRKYQKIAIYGQFLTFMTLKVEPRRVCESEQQSPITFVSWNNLGWEIILKESHPPAYLFFIFFNHSQELYRGSLALLCYHPGMESQFAEL